MINPFQTRFAAIFRNEVLLNTKRVAPYALMIVFSATALMGWRKGPAVALGWATNSDFYVARSLKAFSFLLGLPVFTAVIMGDPVIRDFRLGIDPLIFSKPLSRAQYLLGKFFGNFFVLVCCMATFPLTLLVLQAFRPSQMIVQPLQVVPYFKHFFFFVVITHLAFAAFYFTVGALTRNSKIVYGLAACFYPLYIAYGLFLLRGVTVRERNFLDLFLLNSGPSQNGFGNSADYLNQYILTYTPDMIWNRVLVILVAGVCLTWLYLRFTTAELSKKTSPFGVSLGISTAIENANYDSESFPETRCEQTKKAALRKGIKMKSPFSTPFGAIFQNEVRLNSKRIAPYFMALLCAGNGLLWWGWGPATGHRWAVNADFFIASVLPVYSFLFLPLYTALMMADPSIRDFRVGIDPLIFSKPITRAEYLLGKFFGNFFVLACCQSAFVLTWFVLQAVPKQGVITQDWKVFPYIKHFLVFVVISHLGLAAFYFAVGVLSRNAKIVYGLGVAFYPLYIAYQKVLLSSLPWRWKLALDPLVMNRGGKFHAIPAEVMNQLVVVYETDLIVNRAAMILIAAICLTIVYLRFTIAERPRKVEELSVLNLSTAAEGVYYPESSPATRLDEFEKPDYKASAIFPRVALPEVVRVNEGIRANVNKLIAALGVEFRLLRAERSLVVLMPLAIFLSTLDLAFYRVVPEVSYSATYASKTANGLLLFLIGMTVFYTGEAMHRDREVRIEPVFWATPASNNVLLLSKFLATLALALSLILLVGLTAIVIQIIRGHTPIEIQPFLITYSVILVPSLLFLTAISVALNVLLRNRYLVYVVSVGTGAGLFYLYSIGYKHWLYNLLLYQLWKYADLTGAGNNQARIFLQRLYCLGIASACLSLAHIFFQRKSTKGLITAGRLNGNGWSLLITIASVAIAAVAGSMIEA
jgi:ABC-type transport system involved in multi-copper enzyme maturation permease subunit